MSKIKWWAELWKEAESHRRGFEAANRDRTPKELPKGPRKVHRSKSEMLEKAWYKRPWNAREAAEIEELRKEIEESKKSE